MKKQYLFLSIAFLLTKVFLGQVPTTWTVNPASYQYQMTMTCKANKACVDLADTNNYIAAFVGSQCRGKVKTRTMFPLGSSTSTLGLLTINSNSVSAEKINFKIYNAITNTVVATLDSVIFNQGLQIGTLTSPFILYTNHVPTDISISTYTINENTPLATVVSSLSAVDQDAGTVFTYSLTGAQPENTQFGISGSNLTVNSLFDYETDSIKIIELQVDDNGGCKYAETFTLHIINTNDAPTALTLTTTTIFDHQQAGSYIGQFFTTDPDLNDSHTYSLVSGAGSVDNSQFYIQHDTLYNVNQINYAAQPIYYIRARSTDAGSLFIENTFTLNISNVNDAPTDILLNNNTVNENMPIGSNICTLTVVDADLGDTHTLTLVGGVGSVDNASVTIIGNVLQTNASYNYEQKNNLQIRIQAVDLAGAVFVKTFIININDVNDAPTNINLSDTAILESEPIGTLVGLLTSTDEDVSSSHTYSLAVGLGDTHNALFAINSNSLVANVTYTYTGQIYSIRIKTTDNGSLSFEKIFLIKILNANDAPSDITIDTLFIKEDNDAMCRISKIHSVDLDNPDSYTYSLVMGSGDTDNGEFEIQSDNLIMKNKTNYDVKSLYNLRIKSTDLGGLSFEKPFEISVIDVKGNTIPLPSTNYISPNGDGKNDFWKVDNVEIYKNFELKIFDQFGQIIFNVPNNYNNEFDGKYKGNILPTGNYYYVFKNDQTQFKGNITIIN